MSRIDAVADHTAQALHRIIRTHLPGPDGRCPVCRGDCWVTQQVGEVLAPDVLGWRWAGWPRPAASVAILTRGATPPAGVTVADLVRRADRPTGTRQPDRSGALYGQSRLIDGRG